MKETVCYFSHSQMGLQFLYNCGLYSIPLPDINIKNSLILPSRFVRLSHILYVILIPYSSSFSFFFLMHYTTFQMSNRHIPKPNLWGNSRVMSMTLCMQLARRRLSTLQCPGARGCVAGATYPGNRVTPGVIHPYPLIKGVLRNLH